MDKKTEKYKNIKTRRGVLPLLMLVVIIVVVVFLFGVLGIHVFKSTNIVFRGLSKVIPYPAMVVDWDFVGYGEYADNVVTMRKYLSNEDQATISEDGIRARVLERLIANAVLEDMARERDIKVFDYEVEKEFQQAIEGLDVETEIEKDIERLFGWSIEEYQENVVRPFVLQTKLTQAIYDDQEDAASQFAIFLQEQISTAKVIYFVPH
jgi:hypothetical protein